MYTPTQEELLAGLTNIYTNPRTEQFKPVITYLHNNNAIFRSRFPAKYGKKNEMQWRDVTITIPLDRLDMTQGVRYAPLDLIPEYAVFSDKTY